MTTVVTAFYPIRSKFPSEHYYVWAKEFMRLEAPIVLFTESALRPLFQSMRINGRPLHIVETPFEDLESWKLYKSHWYQHSTMDHELYHTPELYALWAQKAWFVAEAVTKNPFGTTHFFWCDIGAFREPMTYEMRSSFPRVECFPEDRILMCSVKPLADGDWKREQDGIVGNFRYENRIVGGLWGGVAAACLRWRSAYEAQLIRYFTAGRFAGKDQSVMLSAYLEDTSLARIVRPTTKQGDHWFFLEYALSEGGSLETDVSYTRPMNPPQAPILSVNIMGGLGNQLFQVAAGWAHARRTGSRFHLPHNKEPDGRPMYLDSVLHRFRHFCTPIRPMPSWWEPAATVFSTPPQPPSVGLQMRGYFQSPAYFAEYATEIRSLFQSSPSVQKEIEHKYAFLLEQMDRVVVVHARRGDYCATVKSHEYHGPLPSAYYSKAMQQFPKDTLFLLVSDEPLWWMQVIQEIPELQQSHFHILMESDEVLTFGLLQRFQKFILANSSFSWWAAWMADAPTVIAPAKWFGPTGPSEYKDLYCGHWKQLEFV